MNPQSNYTSLPFVEIEVRLGTIVTNENTSYFDNNIDKLHFKQINTALMLQGVWKSIEEISTIEYYYSGNSGGSKKSESIRLIENKNNSSVSMKENIISNTIQLKNSPFDIRFSINQEFSLNSYIKSFNKKECLIRNKMRKSYISDNFKYDLTYVIQTDNNIQKEKYEIEIELLINSETLTWDNKYINDFLECKMYDLIKIVENVNRDSVKIKLFD
jgi:hypothetical protein